MSTRSSSSLPAEWQIVPSKRYPGKFYYFNVVSGISSWEYPNCSIENSSNKEYTKNAYDNKSSTLCQTHQKNKQPQNISLENKSTQKKVNEVVTKPPTAIVAPVIVKKPNDYNSEPLDTALLKRKLEVLYQEQETKKVKNKSKRKKKKKKPENDPEQTCLVQKSENVPKKKNLCTKHLNASLKNAEVQNKRVLSQSTNSSKVINSSIAPRENVQLHVSHNGHSESEFDPAFEDIEMLDVSESLTKIDDLPSSANGSSDNLASYYIVVDTNVLIDELKFIDEIKDTPLEGCGPPHIFIPWIVIQELDRLKNRSTKSTSTWKAAAEAVRYLNSVLKAKHPRFHGQSPQEVADWAKTYSKCNDDRILECCISLATKMPREKVILLTNDKNLSNKALVCDIQVHTWDSMIKVLKTDVVFRGKTLEKKSRSIKRKSNSNLILEDHKLQKAPSTEEISKRQSDIYKQEIHTLMSIARQCLKDVLEPFLAAEMQEAYGDVWHEFRIEQKFLKGILEAIKKYWKAVFSFHFSEKEKRKFDLLFEKANQPEGFFGSKEECLTILSDIEDIFLQIKRHWPHINPCVEKIQNLRASCLAAFSSYNGIENCIHDAESQSVLSLFQHSWSVLNQLCGIIMDYCQIPHDFQYEKFPEFPPEASFRELMCNLYPSVHELKQLMSKVVDAVCNNLPCEDVIKKFFKSLKGFVPSLEVQVDSPQYPHLSSKALEKFCTAPQNRGMIEIGLKQLVVFHEKLDKAITVIMSTKKKRICINEEDKMLCD